MNGNNSSELLFSQSLYSNLPPSIALNEIMQLYPQLYKSSEIGSLSSKHRMILTPAKRSYLIAINDTTEQAKVYLKANQKRLEILKKEGNNQAIEKLLNQNKQLEFDTINGVTTVRIYGKERSVVDIATQLADESNYFQKPEPFIPRKTDVRLEYISKFIDSFAK